MSILWRASVVSLSSVIGVFGVSLSSVAIVNGGFETGDFSQWQTLGRTFIEASDTYSFASREGIYYSRLDTVYPQPAPEFNSEIKTGNFPELLEFMNLGASSLNALGNGQVFEGSAIKTVLSAEAGDILSFDWNFLSNARSQAQFNDFALVTIAGTVNELADSFSNLVLSESVFRNETGFRRFSYTFTTAGEYSLGVGVVDVGDGTEDAGLLLDRFVLLRPAPVIEQIAPPSIPPTLQEDNQETNSFPPSMSPTVPETNSSPPLTITDPASVPEPISLLGILGVATWAISKKTLGKN
ncbi:MAG: hypothetical protein WA919_23970 [Coleofasciculaceae cyanobacterium]